METLLFPQVLQKRSIREDQYELAQSLRNPLKLCQRRRSKRTRLASSMQRVKIYCIHTCCGFYYIDALFNLSLPSLHFPLWVCFRTVPSEIRPSVNMAVNWYPFTAPILFWINGNTVTQELVKLMPLFFAISVTSRVILCFSVFSGIAISFLLVLALVQLVCIKVLVCWFFVLCFFTMKLDGFVWLLLRMDRA